MSNCSAGVFLFDFSLRTTAAFSHDAQNSHSRSLVSDLRRTDIGHRGLYCMHRLRIIVVVMMSQEEQTRL